MVQRVLGEARRQVARAALDSETTVELVQDVLAAVVAAAPFESPRAAQRYAAVAATHLIADAVRRQAIPRPIPLDEADEAELPVAGDDPAEQAVLRAGFAAMVAGLDPPLSDADRDALAYPLTPTVGRSKREQDRIALRLLRVRRRLADEIRGLLAPVVVPFVRWWQGLGTEPGIGYASIAAAVAMGAILGAHVSSGALTADPIPARRAAMPGPVPAVWPVRASEFGTRPGAYRPGSAGAGKVGDHGGATPRAPRPVQAVAARAGVVRGRDATAGDATVAVDVGWWGTNAAHVTVYCDTPVRRAVCAAVPEAPPAG
jgi:hypothetical protein